MCDVMNSCLKDIDNTHTHYDNANVRTNLKVIRDPSKTPYDTLPDGITSIGEYANYQAVRRYTKKVENKRIRAKEDRKRKKRANLVSKKYPDRV